MAERPRIATESLEGRRPYQEDSVLDMTLSDGRLLVAVADGMGGHAAGEVASALAIESLVDALEGGHDLAEAFRLANERVHDKAAEPEKRGMGTTLVAMLLEGDTFRIANVGDSRGYLLTSEGIRQVTEDHSFVAEAIRRGQSEEEARASEWRDALTQAIGLDDHVEVDVFGPFPVEPDSAVLLCSDGLYKTLDADDIRAIFVRSGGPRGASQALAAAAFERGSDDNITVAVAEFGEVPRERARGTMEIEFEPPPPPREEEAAAVSGQRPRVSDVPDRSGPPIGIVLAVVGVLIVVAVLVVALR